LRLAALFLSLGVVSAFADGGAVLLTKQAGPYLVTLFGSPSPLRAGRADLSVLVQNATDKTNVLDAKVAVHLTRRQTDTNSIVAVTLPATHEAATNKMLYAASLNVPSAGDWQVRADIKARAGEASVGAAIRVLPPEPPIVTYWPYFLVIPVVVFLFALNQRLKRARSAVRRRGPA